MKICIEIPLKYIILKEKGKIQIVLFPKFIYLEKKIGLSPGGVKQCFSDSAKEAVKRKPSFPHFNKNNIVNFKVEINMIVCS